MSSAETDCLERDVPLEFLFNGPSNIIFIHDDDALCMQPSNITIKAWQNE